MIIRELEIRLNESKYSYSFDDIYIKGKCYDKRMGSYTNKPGET